MRQHFDCVYYSIIFCGMFEYCVNLHSQRNLLNCFLPNFSMLKGVDTLKQKKQIGCFRLIRRFAKGSILLFIVAVICSILNTAISSLTPQILRVTVDSVIGQEPLNLPDFLTSRLSGLLEGDKGRLLLYASGAILLTAALSGIFYYLLRVCLAKGSENFVKRMRDKLFEHIQKLPFHWHVRNQTGEIIQRCTSDVEVIRNFAGNQLLEVFRVLFLIILSMSIMFSMNAKISLIVLCFIPVVVAYSGIFNAKIVKRFRKADEAEGALSSTVQENLTGVRVVRAFGRERYELDRFDKKNTAFAELWIKLGHVMSYYWGIGDLITGIQILTVIAVGTYATVNGGITLGEFLAFISYNTTLAWPIRSLGRILSEMSKAGVSAARIGDILQAEPEEDAPGSLDPPLNGDLVFDIDRFSYGGQKPVLENLHFTIKAGSTFAILGGTGSGKSTLMHLLNRLYELPPECGRITIGGVDISQIKLSYLREHIGMVLQEPFLFSRTIEENIKIARPEADYEEIRSAAKVACVDEAVSEFTNGYQTIVGERGVTLSGGQKQRVAIARMLMQQAPVMVFDDSLSAVDSETDSKIRAALKNNLGKSTVILISHRITTLMQADQILVLENGKISQQGTHTQLISQDGIYRKIYDIQMSRDDRAQLREEGETNGGI